MVAGLGARSSWSTTQDQVRGTSAKMLWVVDGKVPTQGSRGKGWHLFRSGMIDYAGSGARKFQAIMLWVVDREVLIQGSRGKGRHLFCSGKGSSNNVVVG